SAFFEQHCVKCHSGEKPKGDLRLDRVTEDFADKAGLERWRDILDKLESGEMPPKSKPRPPATDLQKLTAWILEKVTAADTARRSAEGRVVLRRLNRTEYENTVRDLLGVEVHLKDALPLDTAAGGFDNVGEALHLSSFLLEKYLEAADLALN